MNLYLFGLFLRWILSFFITNSRRHPMGWFPTLGTTFQWDQIMKVSLLTYFFCDEHVLNLTFLNIIFSWIYTLWWRLPASFSERSYPKRIFLRKLFALEARGRHDLVILNYLGEVESGFGFFADWRSSTRALGQRTWNWIPSWVDFGAEKFFRTVRQQSVWCFWEVSGS